MEIFLLRLLSCFLMSAAFGILCRIPQSALLWSGAGGALCWAVMYAVSQAGGKLVAVHRWVSSLWEQECDCAG